MEKIKYLPLGSIVYLKNGTKKLMIVARGLLVNNGETRVFYDYGGVTYPEGLQGNELYYIQHESIVKVVHEGFSDYDDEMIVARINSFTEEHPEIERGYRGTDEFPSADVELKEE